MKVIELLTKIANEEEVPKEIKYNACLFAFERQSQDYYCEEYGNLFEYLINEHRTGEFLNDEVEVIENKPFNERVEEIYNRHIDYIYGKEDKKIEKLKDLNTDYYDKECYYEGLTKEEITLDIQTLKHWLNKIIDKINKEDK